MAPMILFVARLVAAVVTPTIPVLLVAVFHSRLKQSTDPSLRQRFIVMCITAFVSGGFFTLTAPHEQMFEPLESFVWIWGLLFVSAAIGMGMVYFEPDNQQDIGYL